MNAARLLVATSVCCLAVTASTIAGKPNTVAATPLIVEIDNSPGMMITGDGAPYSDGELGVSASFDQYGNLIIDFQTTRTPFRKVTYNYSAPVPDTGATPPPVGTDGTITPSDSYWSTVRRTGEGPLQELAEGSSQCVRGYLTFTLPDANKTQYWNGFQRAPSGIDASATSYMVVTRVDSATWSVEPTAACGSGAYGVARLVSTPSTGKSSLTDGGLFSMPFKLTLRAK